MTGRLEVSYHVSPYQDSRVNSRAGCYGPTRINSHLRVGLLVDALGLKGKKLIQIFTLIISKQKLLPPKFQYSSGLDSDSDSKYGFISSLLFFFQQMYDFRSLFLKDSAININS